MIGLILAGLGAGLQAVGSLQAGQAKSDAYTANASYYERQAAYEQVKADYDTARLRERTNRVVAQQRNIYLGQGFTLDGTPTDVAWDSFKESEKDAFAINFTAAVKATNFRAEASNARAQASAAERAGMLGAISAGVKLAGAFLPGSIPGMPSGGGGAGPSVFMGSEGANPYQRGAAWGAA